MWRTLCRAADWGSRQFVQDKLRTNCADRGSMWRILCRAADPAACGAPCAADPAVCHGRNLQNSIVGSLALGRWYPQLQRK